MNELDLFAAAIAIADPLERAALLDRECAGRHDLRTRLDQLLDAHFKSQPLLDQPRPGRAGVATVDSADGQPGTEDYRDPSARVGAILAGKYKLVEEIGEGGMGSVFMAQQTEPVKRAVAVKVIKAGMDSKAVLARFEAERQALAMMDHPNIARVLDAGTTPPSPPSEGGAWGGGRPFFVMELVKGTPITQFCDERKLTPRQRLELFVPVCQAIQHAHQKGIIHRDIKPSNVLVAMYDDRPVPKVIDFGVAKAAGQSLTDKTLMTGFGAVVGTPEYMSPEQANLNNLDIDTRSDVYALGVLLYELLTGTTPVDRKSLGKAALLEVLRIVREVEAPRPSAKLSTIDTLANVAANRGTEPAKLSKLLKGELDWLVLKALEKDRTRRYETANALARDIQRYLADEVVEARPPTVGYRLEKFVRRHKGQVLAASLVMLALLAGMAGTTFGMIRAEQRRVEADEARTREAERAEGERLAKLDAQAATALTAERLKQIETINHTVFEIFTGFDIRKVKEGPDPVEYVLAQKLVEAGKKLDAKAIHDPLVLATLQDRLGLTLLSLGRPQDAIGLLSSAREIRMAKLGPEHPATLASMNNLAGAYQAAGKLDLALPLYEETLKLRKAKLDPEHPDALISMNNLALAYLTAGKRDLALPLFEETVKRQKAKLGPDHPQTLNSMNCLAGAYGEAGKVDLALPLWEETLRLTKAKLGPDHPQTLDSMGNLASAYEDAGKLALALPLLEETFKLRKAKFGSEHPHTLNSMHNLAATYRAAGKFDLALPLAAETLTLMKAKLGPDHPHTLASMGSLAQAYQAAGKRDLALPLHEETLKLRKAKLGPEHPDTFTSMNYLALAYRDVGKVDLALPMFEETLKLRKAKLGPDHPDTLSSMNSLALAYREAGKLDLALPLHEETLKLTRAKLGPEHPRTLASMNNLALAYHAAGKHDLALPLIEETLKLQRDKLGPEHPTTLTGMNNLAGAYWSAKRLDKSIPLFEEALKRYDARLGRDHPDTLRTVANLGVNYKDAGRLKEAIPLLEEAYRASKKYPELDFVMNNLAGAYWSVKQLDKSIPLFEEMLRLKEAKLARDHPETLRTVANLGVNYKDAGRLKEAIPLLEEAYRASKKYPELGFVMNNLAGAYWSVKQLDKSIPLFEEMLKLKEAKLGRDHPETLRTVANLGVNYKDAGRLKEALPLLEEAHQAAKKHPELRWVCQSLLEVYAKADENVKLANLLQEQLIEARKALPKDSPQLAGMLAQISLGLLKQKKWTDAEPLIRECLAIREKTQPDAWQTFNTKSLLGGALLGQKKYVEAEPLLLAGYEGMKQREDKIPPPGKPRLTEALERLIELYTATNKPEEAKKWQAERAKYPETKPVDSK